jgi:serine O-acetyltransferase
MLENLVSNMLSGYRSNPNMVQLGSQSRISKADVIEIINNLQLLVFPGFFSPCPLKEHALLYYIGNLLDELCYQLQKQVAKALPDESKDKAEGIVLEFLGRVPGLMDIISTDVEAFYDGDPAAHNTGEIVLCYPGLYAIFINRLAHELYQLGVPMIPRMMTEHAHSLTGIDINPGAKIGHHFFIDHGTF